MRFRSLFIIFIILAVSHPLQAVALEAQIAVEQNSVYVGEPFIFQIQISGSENPETPDLSAIEGFTIKSRGGQSNSSRSMQIINGQVTQQVNYGYVFTYLFTAKRTGRLIIPPITVHADGKSAITDSITIESNKPMETNELKLRMSVSNRTPYVGEPVTLTYTLYLRKKIRSLQFNIPFLDQTANFYFADPKRNSKASKDLFEIGYQSGTLVAQKGTGELDGKTYTTLQFKKIIIPKKAGQFEIKTATASCEASIGFRNTQRRNRNDFFSDFFNNNAFGRQEVFKRMTVPAPSSQLTVLDVPEKNRPKGYAGHVGRYRIEAAASPLEVSVGDPITLRITLSGPEYMEHIELPPLNEQPQLISNFKVPAEQAEGETKGASKIFTQTIRALRSNVKEIPAIKLVYFDTESGQYQTAETKPIPIVVKAAKVITALDAEGRMEKTDSGSLVETWNSGIAYNYDDLSVINSQPLGIGQWFKSPLWLFTIISGPLCFFIILCTTVVIRRRNADPWTVAARMAYPQFKAQIKKAQTTGSAEKRTEIILEALRSYLSAKLHLPGGVITIQDIREPLADRGIDQPVLNRLEKIIQTCEAGRYAGAISDNELESLANEVLQVGKRLEQVLK